MRSRTPHLPAAALALLTLAACADAPEASAPQTFTPALSLVAGPPLAICGPAASVALLVDETMHAGTVEVVSDDQYLYVTYRTDAAWPIGRTALFVGDDPRRIPTSGGGNPQVGRFPHGAVHPAGTHEVTWRVPLDEAGEESAVIAAFAELGPDAEGAWAEGTQIGRRGSWATYFEYAIAECGTRVEPEEGGTVTFETASLVIPQNSLQDPVFITIEPATTNVQQAVEGTVFDFGPDGLQFSPAASLTLKYDPTTLPPDLPNNALRPFAVNGIFDVLPFTSIGAGEVTFEVNHFSIYGLLVLEADLAVTVNGTPNPARIGDEILFATVVSNTGSPAATVENAEVVLTFSGLGFVRGDLPAGCEVGPGPGPNGETTIFCETGPLGPGDVLPLLIPANTIEFFGPGTIQLDVEVLPHPDFGYLDTAPGNNGSQVLVEVLPETSADLRMKAFGPGPPRQAGLERSISATVESLDTSVDPVDATIRFLFGDAGAVSLQVITDQLPAGCTVAAVSSQTTVNCPVGTLQPGDEAMRTIVVRPLQARFYSVTATGFPLAGDPNTDNNDQLGGFESLATSIDLQSLIVSNHAEVDVGETVMFSAVVNHLSGDLLPQGTLRIEIEGDATLISGDAGCQQIDVFPFAAAFNCPLPQLEAGQNSGVRLITVAAGTGGTDIVGHARLLVPDYVQDTNTANDTDQATTGVRPDNLVDFEVDAFFASTATAKPFEHVTFTANAELLSASGTPVSGAELVVRIEGSDVDFESRSETTCGVSALLFDAGWEMRCPLDDMFLEVRPFSITVSKSTAPGDIAATATIEVPAELQESNSADNTASTGTTVEPFMADVLLSLIGDSPDPVDAGGVITYDVFAESATDSDDLPLVNVRFLATGDVELVSMPTGIDLSCQDVDSNLADVVVLCEITNHEWQNARHLTYGIRALSGPSVSVEAEIFPVPSTTSDPDPSNNLRNEQTTVNDVQPPLEGTLVFGSNRATGSLAQLHTKDLATGVVTRINDTQNHLDPEWSPDGTRIAAFWGARLHVMDADGGNVVEYDLLSLFDIAGAGRPTWSADGTRIAFDGVFDDDAQQDRDLWVLDLATDQVTRLTDNTVQDESPGWSPDGLRIAYTVNGQDLITIDPDGSNPLTVLAATSVRHPDWSPDGDYIAFTQVRPVGSAIRVVEVANPLNIITVAHDDETNVKPAWSPDGMFIAFARAQADDDEAFDLYFALSDGTGAAQVLEAVINFSTLDVDWK